MPLSSENMRPMLSVAILGGSGSGNIRSMGEGGFGGVIHVSLLATSSSRSKSRVLSELYGRLNLHVVI